VDCPSWPEEATESLLHNAIVHDLADQERVWARPNAYSRA